MRASERKILLSHKTKMLLCCNNTATFLQSFFSSFSVQLFSGILLENEVSDSSLATSGQIWPGDIMLGVITKELIQ